MTGQHALNTGAAKSPNFAFLAQHDVTLVIPAAKAERFVFLDAPTALMHLRLLAEQLARRAAAYAGMYVGPEESQFDLVNRLRDGRVLTYEVAQLFHDIRKTGNRAVHQGEGSRREALHLLRVGRELALWFHRAFRAPAFKPGPFVPPPDPADEQAALRAELAVLRDAAAAHQSALQAARLSAAQESELRTKAEREARIAYDELGAAMALAEQTEAEAEAAQALLDEALAQIQAASAKDLVATNTKIEQAREAAAGVDLDEAATRKVIDAQLRDAGWDADTTTLSFQAGVRPTKGRNLAIAEWPTKSGPADYVLFIGLRPVAVVEAKRKNKDVSAALQQAKRYARDYILQADEELLGPWGESKVPFLFATNGRPYLRQHRTKSGIWFQDARRKNNLGRATQGWRTPEGMLIGLASDIEKANRKLRDEPAAYLRLRAYQHEAIRAVEQGIIEGRRNMLLAMATGTGKTRTAIGLVYRLVKARRFHRILFLVDRTALGEQAEGAFKDVKLENLQSFTEIYDVKGLGDLIPDRDTRVHMATIQGVVKRLLFAADEDAPLPVDRYDCIVIDECHRGYNLDREMSDVELGFRSERDYISKYRRALEHFDAVQIGLTATPALHTTDIFGPPVYSYSYRQAVIDGFLVDHEPPMRIVTHLAKDGIKWEAKTEVAVFNTKTGDVVTHETPDDIEIEIEGFNTKVVTESFNRVVCELLAEHIDPSLPGKTLVFCATDAHADLVVHQLKLAFAERYGTVEDDAVVKITGAADKPLKRLRHFKNERNPRVAVTVDLLTTGIDVPQISNIVFIRRVRSRILYEQMLGRATRLCPEIGKTAFRIFDAVDLYDAIQPVSTMRPVVTRPMISFTQLVEELDNVGEPEQRQLVLDQLAAKLQRKLTRMRAHHVEKFVVAAGRSPQDVLALIHSGHAAQVVAFFEQASQLAGLLDKLNLGEGRNVLVSDHDDSLVSAEPGYGEAAARPGDYLESFARFLAENRNKIPALIVVMQRPRDLTRQQLRELKLVLDEAGYAETALRSAWRETKNEDIAASIIGFIRQLALGSPLVPYDERLAGAMKRILAAHPWTAPQRQWLSRIELQLRAETVVDRDALNRGVFRQHGGFKRLNRVFDGRLEVVLGDIQDELWKDAS